MRSKPAGSYFSAVKQSKFTLYFFSQTPAAAGGVFHSHSTGCQNNGRGLDLGSNGSGKNTEFIQLD